MKTFQEHIAFELDPYNKRSNDYDYVFIIIKPGFERISDLIINRIKEDGWNISRTCAKRLLPVEAKKLYSIHKDEDWYDDLCKYMSSGPSIAILWSRKKKDSDPFKDMEKIKDELREKYGESDMRNVMHSSDSEEHQNNEMHIYI